MIVRGFEGAVARRFVFNIPNLILWFLGAFGVWMIFWLLLPRLLGEGGMMFWYGVHRMPIEALWQKGIPVRRPGAMLGCTAVMAGCFASLICLCWTFVCLALRALRWARGMNKN
jgi:hypothetical protein